MRPPSKPGARPSSAPIKWRLETRYQIVAACFLATFTAYVERVGFSIAFTAMAKEAALDEAVKGTVLSAFYWGYALSQIPGGWAAQRYGGRLMLILCFALWSTVSLLTPGNAAAATGSIVAARVAIGVAQGFLIPAVHTVLSQWIPPHERARAVSLTTSGMYLGSAASMLALPPLAAAAGPPALLRAVGALGLAWLVLWLAVGREIPHRDTVIPLANTPTAATPPGHMGQPHPPQPAKKGRPPPTPWRRMLSSPAVWAIVSNNFAFHYAFYVVMNWLPTYYSALLHSELSGHGAHGGGGAAATLPYLVMFGMSNAGGWAGDWLIGSHGRRVGPARKAVNTAGFAAAGGALMLMPGARGVGSGLAATTLTLGALGFSRGGFSVNHMDIAPKYAGVLMGISNTAGTLAGVVGVAATGVLLDAHGGAAVRQGWFVAHAVAAGICGCAAVIFNACARGERLFD